LFQVARLTTFPACVPASVGSAGSAPSLAQNYKNGDCIMSLAAQR
jgi:hypothetical protein